MASRRPGNHDFAAQTVRYMSPRSGFGFDRTHKTKDLRRAPASVRDVGGYWRICASRAASIIARIAFAGGAQPSRASRQLRNAARYRRPWPNGQSPRHSRPSQALRTTRTRSGANLRWTGRGKILSFNGRLRDWCMPPRKGRRITSPTREGSNPDRLIFNRARRRPTEASAAADRRPALAACHGRTARCRARHAARFRAG